MIHFELFDEESGNLLGHFDSAAEAMRFALQYPPAEALNDLRVLRVDGDRVAVAMTGADLMEAAAAPDTLPTRAVVAIADVLAALRTGPTSPGNVVELRPAYRRQSSARRITA
ncbi:MAG: hypothetical protein ABSA21_13515 [Candidatus Limnocylindrales bacterium]|jgi:hypothetical protein